jgi:hypothetical protein
MIFIIYFIMFIKMSEEELWKVINGYSKYEISSNGRIRNINGVILKQGINAGYNIINIFGDDKKRKKFYIHRLVSSSFLDIENGKTQVNHKDGNKENNSLTNLEWTSPSENIKHAYNNNLINKYNVEIEQYTKDGIFIKLYSSLSEASKENNIDTGSIAHVCKGQRKSSGGFIWKYKNSKTEEIPANSMPITEFPNYLITKEGRVYNIKRKQYMEPKKQGKLERVKLTDKTVSKTFCIHNLVKDNFEISNTQ